MSGHVSDEDREALVAWFHREFGYHRCVHPVNSEPQCEAWASQFLRSAPASALITRHVREALNAAADDMEQFEPFPGEEAEWLRERAQNLAP